MVSLGDYFAREFNKTLARPLGRRVAAPRPDRPPTYRQSLPSEARVARQVRQGIIDLPTNTENFYESVFGERATGGTGGGLLDAIQRGIKEQQVADVNEAAAKLEGQQSEILESNRIAYAARMDELRKENEAGARAELFNQYKKQGFSDEDAKLAVDFSNQKSIAEKYHLAPLTWIDRPQQAVFGAMAEGAGDKKSYSQSFSDALKGAWRGLAGSKKYDPGKIMEEYFPAAPQAAKIGGAVGLSLFADPLVHTGLGAGKRSMRTGKLLTAESAPREIAQAVVDAMTDVQANMNVGTRARRNPVTGKFGNPWEAATETRRAATEADIENLILGIGKGGVKGRLNLGEHTELADTIAGRQVEGHRNWVFQQFNNYLEQFRAHADDVARGGQGLLSPKRIKVMRQQSKHFDDFMNSLPTGIKPRSGGSWKSAIDSAADVVYRQLDKEMDDLTKAIYDRVMGSYRHAPTIRLGEKHIQIPYIGKALRWGQERVTNPDSIRRMSHAGQFPGKLALLMQRGRSVGAWTSREFEKRVGAIATQYNREQRKEIIRAIENNRDFPHDPHMQTGLDFVKQELDRMWNEEVASGARNANRDHKLSNYTFVWSRKGNKHALDRFKEGRKKQINSNARSAAGYTVADAAAKGFKPVDDAFSMLLYRQMKSSRDITRATFRNDVLDNYGTVARGLNPAAAARRKLIPYGNDKLSSTLRARANEEAGDSWYLPESMDNVLNEFREMSRFDMDNPAMRVVRKVTNFFKSATTVYNFGYHVRNMISDIVMGILDKVKPSTYSEMMLKGALSRQTLPGGGRTRLPRFHIRDGAKFKIGDRTLTAHEFRELFHKNATGGGYVSAEFGVANPLRRGASRVNRAMRSFSESREDFGRMVHFLSALRDEYASVSRYIKNSDRAWEKAIEQATYRVNHYKFDYGALTKWEQRIVKPIVPFYTFTRKAVPTLFESFMMQPKWIHRYQMLRESRDGDDAKNFMGYEIPQWAKDVGFTTLRDEKEPWISTFDPLPTSSMGNVIPPEKSLAGLSQNLLEQINPVAQIPIELAQGETIFSNKDINNNWQYLFEKFGGPGAAAQKAAESSQQGLSPWQIAMTNRLGLGLPFRKIPQEQQDYLAKAWEDKNIEAPFNKFNEGEGQDRGIKISRSIADSPEGMSSYKVVDTNTGRTLWQGIDPWLALRAAKQHRGAPLPMSMNDWNDTVGKKNNIRMYYSQRKDGSSYRVRNTKTNKVIGDFDDPMEAYEAANASAGG